MYDVCIHVRYYLYACIHKVHYYQLRTCTRTHSLNAQVNNAAFSHNHGNKLGSNYFVTVHHRRVQYWYYGTAGKDTKVHMYVLLCRCMIVER